MDTMYSLASKEAMRHEQFVQVTIVPLCGIPIRDSSGELGIVRLLTTPAVVDHAAPYEEGRKLMRQIRISLRTSAARTELDFDDLETTKLLIEVCASRALLELLGSLIVDDVAISVDDALAPEDDVAAWYLP
jgi:hypothetical protein